MWTNKHVVVAMLVAPVLAVLSWMAVDRFVGEQPHEAKAGAAYPLVARSNCRYASGRCDLHNNDFQLTLERLDGGAMPTLQLESRHALSAASLALGKSAATLSEPRGLTRTDGEGLSWSLPVAEPVAADGVLRLAVVAGQSTYYAEFSAAFLAPASDQ
ncbi:MAG: hypothetical protein AAFX56_17055 [Pseudomonadota bacterium]